MSLLNPFPPRPQTVFGLIAAWALAWLPVSAFGQDGPAILAALEDSFTTIIEAAEPSVVSIARIGKPTNIEGDTTGELRQPGVSSADPADFIPSEFGAGVIFEPADQPGKRFILTMYHVVKGGKIAGQAPAAGDELIIRTHKRQQAAVEIVAADPRSDLAVLQISEGQPISAEDLKPIRMAKSPAYKKGQFVFTLGNPYAIARDGSACAGWGMLSNTARVPKPVAPGMSAPEKARLETLHHQGTLLQIDGNLNLGTSGGPVLNRKGELIGIVTAMAALDGYEKSVGYAVPLSPGIGRVITELAHGYEAEYGLLGIQLVTAPFPGREQPTATRVEAVGAFSPAGKAGVLPDDMIYAVDDVTIYTREDLMREIGLIGPGAEAKLRIYRPRGRQRLTKTVTLTKWPVHNAEDIIATRHRHEWNGIVIDYATARDGHFGQQYRPAVLITHKREIPQLAQLREGNFVFEVDGRPVTSPEEFDAAVQGKTEADLLVDGNRTVHVPALK